ncbi:MAG: PH domain-containing protein [Smithellaceae bacterium]
MHQIYKIKKSFLIPFVAAVALLGVLSLVMMVMGETWEFVSILLIFFVALAICVEASRRQVVASEDGLQIRKFFRTKHLVWAEITHLGMMVVRNKAYFLLTTTRGFIVLSNLIEKHALLIRFLAGKLGEEKVEPDVNTYLEHPIERLSLLIMTWVAVAVIIAVIVAKLMKL